MELVEVFASDNITLLAKGWITISLRVRVIDNVVLENNKVGVLLVEVLVIEAFPVFQTCSRSLVAIGISIIKLLLVGRLGCYH